MVGGTMMVIQLPSPIWFNVIDLTLAYLPMSWMGIGFFLHQKLTLIISFLYLRNIITTKMKIHLFINLTNRTWYYDNR